MHEEEEAEERGDEPPEEETFGREELVYRRREGVDIIDIEYVVREREHEGRGQERQDDTREEG